MKSFYSILFALTISLNAGVHAQDGDVSKLISTTNAVVFGAAVIAGGSMTEAYTTYAERLEKSVKREMGPRVAQVIHTMRRGIEAGLRAGGVGELIKRGYRGTESVVDSLPLPQNMPLDGSIQADIGTADARYKRNQANNYLLDVAASSVTGAIIYSVLSYQPIERVMQSFVISEEIKKRFEQEKKQNVKQVIDILFPQKNVGFCSFNDAAVLDASHKQTFESIIMNAVHHKEVCDVDQLITLMPEALNQKHKNTIITLLQIIKKSSDIDDENQNLALGRVSEKKEKIAIQRFLGVLQDIEYREKKECSVDWYKEGAIQLVYNGIIKPLVTGKIEFRLGD